MEKRRGEDEEAATRGGTDLEAVMAAHLEWLRAAAGSGRPDRAAALARHRETLDAVRTRAEEPRRRIMMFNLTVPIVSRQMMNVSPDA